MSAARRWLLFFAGWLCIGLGLLGAVLPVLPTTPFILLAAACFARSSPRFHAWLRDSRLFGAMVREWEAHRSIPYRTKVRAIVVMALTMGVSVVFVVEPPVPFAVETGVPVETLTADSRRFAKGLLVEVQRRAE